MRGAKAEIALDYGMLADDLEQFQRAGSADAVRRRWARQFYHLAKADQDQNESTDTEKENN